jgi:ABC-type cobalamin/Fe3+-siderophores transport system ATPase subunit
VQAEKTNQPTFMIKIIEIENIKGIDQKTFDLGISPNKPSLLVAPNGFGKSSLATAFNSMNSRKITLAEDDLHAESVANLPRIAIEYIDVNGTTHNLEATNDSNTISSYFDYFVINNLTKPKGIGSRFGNATARLEIKDVVLVDRIPVNTQFGYSYRNNQADFGNCGKVLPNANSVLTNLVLVEKLSENYQALQRANGNRIQQRLNLIIDSINAQDSTVTANVLNNWVYLNCLDDLKQIAYLNTIGNLINEFDIGYNCETKSYLAAIQIISLYNNDPNNFKSACTFSNYRLDKKRFDQTLTTFNCTWRNISTRQTGGKLVVKFPQAIHISNGQSDILTFISMLFRAKRHLKKGVNILIIDEVFDYLDDANLTAAQYYITQFIKDFKLIDKKIYPLILTHLNPNYFKNFTFSNQKVYYLNKTTVQVAQGIINLLRNRDDLTIKDDVSKYLLHYEPGTINKRNEFRALSIPELWGENDNFKNHLNNEVQNYLSDQPYDPFAICGGLRIEEIAYNKLQSPDARTAFLGTHKTRSKLEKAEEMGFTSPESHYLLGIIYNEGMHWKLNQDNVSPIAAKLENLTIKKLIADVFS